MLQKQSLCIFFTCMVESYLALLVVVRILGRLDVSVMRIQFGALVISFKASIICSVISA